MGEGPGLSGRPGSADRRRRLAELLLRRELAAERAAGAPVRRPRPAEPAPLSPAQERLWLVERIYPESAAYNELSAFTLRGPLDTAVLRAALAELVHRHEALRTAIVERDDVPMQVVVPDAALTLTVDSVDGLPVRRREAAAAERAAALGAAPFDLGAPPLLRVALIRLAERHHLLVLAVHHIVSDGWSIRVLAGELIALYAAACEGRPAALPPPGVQYADYAVWQRERLESPEVAARLAHWRNSLAGAPEQLELPTDRPRPARESHAGAEYLFTLPEELVERLERRGREEGATLFMVLLAGYFVLLSRYCGREDLLVGTPYANRAGSGLEGAVGCFATTLLVRGRLSEDPTVRELLRTVRGTVLAALDNGDVPFEWLVRELRPQRALDRNPLFQTVFALHNQPVPLPPPPTGLTVEPVPRPVVAAKVDLELSFLRTPAGLDGHLEYSTDLFDPSTVQRMAAHLGVLLAAMAEDPDRAVHDLPLLTPAEAAGLAAEWRGAARHGGQDGRLRAVAGILGCTTDDVWLLAHDRGWEQAAARHCAREAMRQDASAGGLARALAAGADVLCLPASALPALTAAYRGPRSGNGPRLVLLRGDGPVPPDTGAWFARHGDRGPQLVSVWGPERTGGWGTLLVHRSDGGVHGPLGGAAPGTALAVVDARGRPVPPGVPGELLIWGPSLDGAGEGSAVTAPAGVDLPEGAGPCLATGLRVRRHPAGHLLPAEPPSAAQAAALMIEEALRRHPGVRDARVQRRGSGLVAYVVPALAAPPPVPALRRFLSETLPGRPAPGAYVYAESLDAG
ncbi:condensation domain-containing protein [Allonocardiopsis opalescens]|uniref:AMP-binding enzyme n=1 Tax=Allonocardiopsis opalescens TaxID=1144618 RepID=A0A2T0PYP8_9ACTN|nr:condensation domain-containing protein [Allonocardiopsis opalescens]PRX96527.1 AMP-binding enzyme [Allonocardiopsis opalescens]